MVDFLNCIIRQFLNYQLTRSCSITADVVQEYSRNNCYILKSAVGKRTKRSFPYRSVECGKKLINNGLLDRF